MKYTPYDIVFKYKLHALPLPPLQRNKETLRTESGDNVPLSQIAYRADSQAVLKYASEDTGDGSSLLSTDSVSSISSDDEYMLKIGSLKDSTSRRIIFLLQLV